MRKMIYFHSEAAVRKPSGVFRRVPRSLNGRLAWHRFPVFFRSLLVLGLIVAVGLPFLIASPDSNERLGQASVMATEGQAVAESTDDAQDPQSRETDQAETSREANKPAGSASASESKRPRVSLLRPAMPAQQRSEWATRLRQIYSQPPARWPSPFVDRSVAWKELGLLPKVEHPADNPHSQEKERLGKLLFFDPRLSGSGQMACASCHDPDLNWGDGRTTGIGNRRKVLSRNTPSILNAGFSARQFWDGRAESLESQALAVLLNPDEMHASEEIILPRLNEVEDYRKQFAAVFGGGKITLDAVVQALACYERTLVGGRSDFDDFLNGDQDALSDEATIGLHLFRTRARCLNCHHGPEFSDSQFHDLGLSYYGRKLEDLGRYNFTNKPEDVGKFKTPTLRNIAHTGPYMHNGLFPLRGVMNLYNAGMPTLRRKEHQADDPLFPTKSPLLQPLYLNRQDLDALTEFLHSLSEPPRRVRPPELPGME